MKPFKYAFAAAALACVAAPAQAHFQLIYTPEANLEKPAEIPFLLLFWHPFENGHAMDMAKPEQFFVLHGGKKTDLLGTLTPVTFNGSENKAAAFETKVPVRQLGDYVFGLVPAPYREESEDIFIQQFTKSFVNQGGTPTDWDQPLGLKAEIIPFVKPTGVMVGSTFTGQVLTDGKPVANVEIEIEYIAAAPDLTKMAPGPVTTTPPPGGTPVVRTDANGMFTFGVPKAGYWGFAALGAGPDKEFQGKELSQDAVIWVRANDLK